MPQTSSFRLLRFRCYNALIIAVTDGRTDGRTDIDDGNRGNQPSVAFPLKLMKMAEMRDLQDIVIERRRRFAGHILRLPEERPAKVAMTWTPRMGRRKKGRPKKTWRQTFREDLDEMGMAWNSAAETANDRVKWRKLVARCSSRSGRN